MLLLSTKTGLLCATLLSALTLCAQQSGVGLKAAVQWCDLHAPGADYRAIPGASGGIYLPLGIGTRFELQPELLISAQGAAFSLPEGETGTIRTMYAQLPVVAKLYVSNALNAQIGVMAGRLLSANVDGEDVKDHLNSLDLGFSGGVGLDLSSGLDLTARYSMSRTTLWDGEPFLRNQVASLGFGYRIARLPKSNPRRRG